MKIALMSDIQQIGVSKLDSKLELTEIGEDWRLSFMICILDKSSSSIDFEYPNPPTLWCGFSFVHDLETFRFNCFFYIESIPY